MEILIEKILSIIIGVGFLFSAYFNLKKGKCTFRYGTTYFKEKDTNSFWLCVGWKIILGLLVIIVSAYLILN